MIPRRWVNLLAASIAIVLVLSPTSFPVDACGPDFTPEVFVRTDIPDNMAAFAHGKLGLLHSSFDSNELAVAYRYLSGSTLSASEQAAIIPPETSALTDQQWQAQEDAEPSHVWMHTRAIYLPADAKVEQYPHMTTTYGNYVSLNFDYLNCPDDSFTTAVKTLKSRAAAWGAKSPWLLDWLHAQDAVYANCAQSGPAMPAPAPAGSPALLLSDRAYQIASALFYEGRFDEAATRFAAIAEDKSSPWQSWGGYLAARATVRKAFAMGKPTDPYNNELATFDAATMQRAQQMLEALLAARHPDPSRRILTNELNFVRMRTEPARRIAEICTALAGPAPDPGFSQHLADLNLYLVLPVPSNSPPPLIAWIKAMRDPKPDQALEGWRKERTLPWLVAAMMRVDASNAAVPELLAAAAEIAPSSPSYDTLFYHRVRVLIGLHRNDEARGMLNEALTRLEYAPASSYKNALLAERFSLARNLDEFLTDAPRTVMETGSEAYFDAQNQCSAHLPKAEQAKFKPSDCPALIHPSAFSLDAVMMMNRNLPTSVLVQVAASPKLPKNLRRDVALAAWTRSVLLRDAANAAKLAPMLPTSLKIDASSGVGFTADLAILRSDGIRPYVEDGISRLDSLNTFDDFRDNWWCGDWMGKSYSEYTGAAPVPLPNFLTAAQNAEADAEFNRLRQLPDSAEVLGDRVIAYAKAHPDDVRVPEALALAVRATHYSCQSWSSYQPGKTESPITPISKAAFELLHRRYPKSPWTKKTRYYY